jgi:hypothetical protein
MTQEQARASVGRTVKYGGMTFRVVNLRRGLGWEVRALVLSRDLNAPLYQSSPGTVSLSYRHLPAPEGDALTAKE